MSVATAPTVPVVVAGRPRPTPHRLGMLFEILEEMGEDPTFTFELARVGEATPLARAEIHHAESDGHGGLSRVLTRRGVAFESPRPRTGETAPPLHERVRAVVRVARHRGAEPLVLRRRDTAWVRGTKVTARPGAGTLLSASATARVVGAAKAAGVSVGAHLLHALTEAVVPLLAEPGRSVTWGVPVNMRGPVQVEPAEANASSIMPVDVPRGGDARAVHDALQRALAAKLHWGKWDQLNLIARLGKRFLKKKVEHYYRTADPARIGVFSNVGAWTGRTDDDLGILAYGVPAFTDPLFATVLTWNGKLALTLRAHPSLATSDGEVAGWRDAWLAKLEVTA
ncbi:MAG: hypothetical protein JNL83_40345 [Myxococcales bacterium]|nr:hypothetical protein [Myxococcales bacterium]